MIGAVTILTSRMYVAFEYAKPGFPTDRLGFTTTERLEHAVDNIRFLRGSYPVSFLENQRHGKEPLYDLREISHMKDVQQVFQGVWKTGKVIAVLFFVLAGVMVANSSYRALLYTALERGGELAAGIVTVIGLLAIIGWNQWFTTFHQVFFPPGTWTFSTNSTLIRLFPINFWFDSALTASSITLIGVLVFAFVGKRLWERSNGETVTS